jgi:radical SAM superfamily enzyme YgiQ (UPF0313 family)
LSDIKVSGCRRKISPEEKIALLHERILRGDEKNLLLVDPGKGGVGAYGDSTAYALTVLKHLAERQGWRAEKFKLPHELASNALEEKVAEFKPLIVGFTSTSPGHAKAVREASKIYSDNILLIKGGVHETCSFSSIQSLNYPFDISFLGESDISFPKMLSVIESGGSLDSVEGIAYMRKTGLVVQGGPQFVPAEQIILPDPKLLEVEEPFKILGGKRMVRIQSMRGCLFRCTFCAISHAARRVPPEILVQYIKRVVEQTNADRIFFEDSTFTIDRHAAFKERQGFAEWTEKFCKLMKPLKKKGLRWGCQTRADCLDPETLKMMREAGCVSVYIGIEALDNDALEKISKEINSLRAIRTLVDAKSMGMMVTASIIGDIARGEEFERTLELLKSIGVQEIFIEAYKVFPGTRLANEVMEKMEVNPILEYSYGIPKGSSPNEEDHYCLLLSPEEVVRQQYEIANRVLSETGLYNRISAGHFFQKDVME